MEPGRAHTEVFAPRQQSWFGQQQSRDRIEVPRGSCTVTMAIP